MTAFRDALTDEEVPKPKRKYHCAVPSQIHSKKFIILLIISAFLTKFTCNSLVSKWHSKKKYKSNKIQEFSIIINHEDMLSVWVSIVLVAT